jgi:hypothetical protein
MKWHTLGRRPVWLVLCLLATVLPAPAERQILRVRASEIDPRARPHPEIGFVFEKDGKPQDVQHASVDTAVPLQGKLVIWLMGYNDGLFQRLNSYGLHAIQVHYANQWFGTLEPRDRMARGSIRLEAATGLDVSDQIEIPPPDGMMERATQLVKWLANQQPAGEWRQFLTDDTTRLRWDKVIVSGASHGATTAARFAKHIALDRVVMLCGPRDQEQDWQSIPSATAPNRFFGFSHVLDTGWTGHHYCRSWEMLGLHQFGPVVDVDAQPPPYGHTRRLVSAADVGGDEKRAHSAVTPGPASPKASDDTFLYEPVWKYLYTHPVESVGQPVAADPSCRAEPRLEPVVIAPDGQGFVLAASGQPFRVWGLNYDHDSEGEHGRLLEDYWVDEWDTVVADFREMKDLGANVVRIHLQFGRFMTGPTIADEASLAQLRRLLTLAEETGLYLDLTGLGCYHKADTPAWYDAMGESERWEAQARFWAAIARTCRGSNAVFCYDLMNEPVVDGRTDQGWLAGELGGKHFVQRLTLEQGTRTPVEVAGAWVRRLTAVIRAEDPGRLITVGVIPWSHVWPDAKPIFYAPEVRDHLDFVSIHLYPKQGDIDRALAAMDAYTVGKPLVIEETFPLACSLEEMDTFLTRSKPRTAGHMSFYWGLRPEEYAATSKAAPPDLQLRNALIRSWLEDFRARAAVMKAP